MEVMDAIRFIQDMNARNKLVVFIGAGVSANSGYKSWPALVRQMDRELGYSKDVDSKNYSSDELLKIPQFLRDHNKEKYQQILHDNFGWLPESTNPIVDIILDLRPQHIITTNYDRLIELSLSRQRADIIKKRTHANYAEIYQDQDLANNEQDKLLIKMHGDIATVDNIVLTEKDYLDFSQKHPIIETFIKTLLLNHSFLFLGYGLGDYNLKLIMNWVDTAILQSGTIDIKQQKHFYVNGSHDILSQYDQSYFKNKNIYVIEATDLVSLSDEKYTNSAVSLTDDRGKLLYYTINEIMMKKDAASDMHAVYELLLPFANQHRVLYADIEQVLDLEYSPLCYFVDNTLYYFCDGEKPRVFNRIDLIVQMIVGETESHEATLIRRVFLKAGVKRIINNKENPITYLLNEDEVFPSWGEHVICHNYTEIRNMLADNACRKTEEIFLRSFIGDKESAEYIVNSFPVDYNFANFVEEFSYLRNRNLVSLNYFDNLHQLASVFSDMEKRYFSTILDYVNNFEHLLSMMSKVSGEIKRKYSPYEHGKMYENGLVDGEYKALATQVRHIPLYFVYNGIYLYGGLRYMINSSYTELLKAHLDLLFFFQSNRCNKTKYDRYHFHPDDISIILNIIDQKDLVRMLQYYQINKLELSQGCIDYMLTVFRNVAIEHERRFFSDTDPLEFYHSEIIEKICKIVGLLDLSDDDAMDFTTVACRILRLANPMQDTREYDRTIVHSYYNILLDRVYSVGRKHGTAMTLPIKETLEYIINEFVTDDLENHYSSLYEEILEPTRVILNLGIVLKQSGVLINEELAEKFFDVSTTYFHWYGKALLIDAYNIVSPSRQALISKAIHKEHATLSFSDIFVALDTGIIQYCKEIENRLIRECERLTSLEKNKLPSNWDSPYYLILRLHEKGILNEDALTVFERFSQRDDFFHFVCFPESFDFENFNVDWYTWLSYQKYRAIALSKENISIVGNRFAEAIDNGTTEEIKVTYYRLFYDAIQSKDQP